LEARRMIRGAPHRHHRFVSSSGCITAMHRPNSNAVEPTQHEECCDAGRYRERP
jgi:hypothetical protein